MLNRTQLEIHASLVHLHLLLIADSKPSSNGLYTSHIKHVKRSYRAWQNFPRFVRSRVRDWRWIWGH